MKMLQNQVVHQKTISTFIYDLQLEVTLITNIDIVKIKHHIDVMLMMLIETN